MKKKEEWYSFSQQNNGAMVETDMRMIPLSELHDFNGHPFKVEKAACKWAGIDVMPVVIRDLDDNQAVIDMVDSNLQREHLKTSEKAFAYKMKLEAMKRQGTRTDLTSSQVGKKLSSSQVVTGTSDQVGPKLEKGYLYEDITEFVRQFFLFGKGRHTKVLRSMSRL